MTILYVRSTDGNNADSGLTWALAKATVAGALAIAAAGDTIYVSQAHAETQASAMTWTSPGTITAPVKIICANDAAEPPTAVATTATVTTTSNSAINFNGGLSVYGIIFNCSSGATGAGFVFHNTTSAVVQAFEKCKFRLVGTATGNRIQFGGSGTVSGQLITWKDCDVKFGSTGQRMTLRNAYVTWDGGSWESGGSTPVNMFLAGAAGVGAVARVSNVDLSNLAATVNVLEQPNASATGQLALLLRQCKLPSAWSGSVFSAAPAVAGIRVEMHNCDGGDVEYGLWVEDYAGSTRHETTVVHTGGASPDGSTVVGWKMVGSANAVYPHQLCVGPDRAVWNDAIGSSKTCKVQIISDSSSGVTDGEMYLAVDAMNTSGFPLGTTVTDAKADLLATAAAQASSTEAWDGPTIASRANSTFYAIGDRIKVASNPGRLFFCFTSGTTAGSEPGGYASATDGSTVSDGGVAVFRAGVRQELSVSFTPQEKGPLVWRPILATNKTAYVDANMTVT